MADHSAKTTEENASSNSLEHISLHEHEDPFASWTGRMLDRGDTIIYAIVGACFFLGGFFALGYSFWNFINYLVVHYPLSPTDVAESIVQLISDLLLVVIIMEVLGTVIHYLRSHVTSLRPFLFIGIISATRGILLIGARLTVQSGAHTTKNFTSDMIELGVNAAVILALGITLRLLGKSVDDYSQE